MLIAALALVLTTTPPLIQAPEPTAPPPTYAPVRRFDVKQPKKAEPLKDSRFGLIFHPFNVFALALWVEGDLHLAGGVSVFANVGGGFLGQFGWDAGLRYFINGTHLEGFYIDARNSGFSLPAHELWMTGPGVQLGYSWRTPAITIAIAAGFTTWFNLNVGRPSAQFLGVAPIEADVLIFPGVARPGPETPAVAPTIRLAIGPWF